jgi:hypothetical protein
MSDSGPTRHPSGQLITWMAVALLCLAALTGLPLVAAATPSPHVNAAGLVIKHGDGTLLYYYVQFSERDITGTQLLERAGVSIDTEPYAGIGLAMCRIDGEGCPSTNCFCKSFANPAVYWRYHKLDNNGSWQFLQSGPDQRMVHDGDVDGWSWSSQDNDLPPITLAQIARINGISQPATPQSTMPAASVAATSAPSSAAQIAHAAPTVVGVQVQSSGQTQPVNVSKSTNNGSTNYVWFGLGVALLLVAGAVVLLRQRWSGQ